MLERGAARVAGRRVALLAGGLVLGLVGSGCAAFTSDRGSAGGSGLLVVTSFYPLEFVAQRIVGDHGVVDDLTQLGQEPHDLELTIEETAQIAQSDLVVYESGLQPAVDEAVGQNAGGAVIDASQTVALRPFPPDAEVSGTDPHFWQDPLLLAQVADAVAARLEQLDPANAADYRANDAALDRQLEQLDHDYRVGLADCAVDTVVVSHAAFGYLSTYGVHMVAIAGLSPDAEPTPADLQRLQQVIAADHVTTVFGERLAPPQLTETLAADAGVTTAVLDPIEGLTDQTRDQDYLSLMRENLSALRTAGSCR